MLVKDELDILEFTLRHLRGQVDQIIVADNGSTDGTREMLDRLSLERGRRNERWPLLIRDDAEVGYHQADKTTVLAREALELGFDWVVPVDADEFWYSPHGRIADVLATLPAEVHFARAPMFNHVASGEDPAGEPNPFVRLGWHFREQGAMAKIACRTNLELRIDMGNHDATSAARIRSNWHHTAFEQLWIHHFPWRSEAQLQRKIANGARAYAAAPDLDPTYGEHWKAFGNPDVDADFDERVAAWFWQWGYRATPSHDEDLIYAPAVAQLVTE
jgi:hypothetical protein